MQVSTAHVQSLAHSLARALPLTTPASCLSSLALVHSNTTARLIIQVVKRKRHHPTPSLLMLSVTVCVPSGQTWGNLARIQRENHMFPPTNSLNAHPETPCSILSMLVLLHSCLLLVVVVLRCVNARILRQRVVPSVASCFSLTSSSVVTI